MGWLTIRNMPIPPGLYTCSIVLKILCLGDKHPTKLIMALLDKVSKSGALKSNKCSKENLLLLNGSKGVLEVRIVRRGWLRRRFRYDFTK